MVLCRYIKLHINPVSIGKSLILGFVLPDGRGWKTLVGCRKVELAFDWHCNCHLCTLTGI